ncbi:MAG: RNA polymerase sigma factor RpoH [Gammaproteobacteria bacterium]|nr:RNA polymerase sigma factor RpoH [Gammaproteobacteria bacterium]
MAQTLPITLDISGASSLTSYIQAINSVPLLSAEEEYELAQRYSREEDLDAARQLVLAHLRFVVRVARGFMGYGLPLADLVQEGNVGLMKAVKRYDPNRDVRLVSFAVHWIRAEIYEFILRNWRIVKVATTKAQRKLFFNLRKSRQHLGWMNQQEVGELALELDVPAETVQEMESRMSSMDVPFDGTDRDNEDSPNFAPANFLQDSRFNPEHLVVNHDTETGQRDKLQVALAGLDRRSNDIIQRRWLDEDKQTLHQLADEYGVSAERIRQIEKRALEKLRNSFEER